MGFNADTKPSSDIYDLIGIGLGPFNLSLAALAEPISELNCVFFESKPQFDWHPGLLMEDCTLQVPMMADLVSMADPTSYYSYLNYLHCNQRLYHFYFYEDFLIPRQDYNFYCRWVAEQLSGLHFNTRVIGIEHIKRKEAQGGPEAQGCFEVTVQDCVSQEIKVYRAKNLVLGTGTEPNVPRNLSNARNSDRCNHSANYLDNKANIQQAKNICVIGAGQSAGEIVLDLLNDQEKFGYEINWFTRGDGFLPMEYSKLGLEHFSPDYCDYFHALPESRRDQIRAGQDLWYKGMSSATIADIYDRIYRRSIGGGESSLSLQALSELKKITENQTGLELEFYHRHQEQNFYVQCDQLILATGHRHCEAQCLTPLNPWLERDSKSRLVIKRDYTLKTSLNSSGNIYVQNAELHSHGIGAPDLGLGAYRSASIINGILDRPHYRIRQRNVFQNFGIAEKWREQTAHAQPETVQA